MTNAELEKIFKGSVEQSMIAGLRAVWSAGYYEGAGITPTATSVDKSLAIAKPVAIIKTKHTD